MIYVNRKATICQQKNFDSVNGNGSGKLKKKRKRNGNEKN